MCMKVTFGDYKATMLRSLLNERFFNSCLVHEEDKKNEENCFCTDCRLSLCCHCVPHHRSHKILQIRRYMYNDVLRLKEAQKIFDCSLIQSYTTNGERIVLLRSRSRISIPIRGSRCTCLVCGQSIKSSFVYCSMACKFSTTVTASKGGQRVYDAYSSQDADESLLVSSSFGESLASVESAVEENSAIATASDVANYESMNFVQEGRHTEQNKSATSSNRITRMFHGRKRAPQRSPLF